MADQITNTSLQEEARDSFAGTLRAAVSAIEGTGAAYLGMGDIASSALGRPRWTRDIEIFVRPEHAERVLEALASEGFRTERPTAGWLYKAYRDDVVVDVVFQTQGAITVDEEMIRRARTRVFSGVRMPMLPPEDLLVIKAFAHSEANPSHWHDALALLAHHDLDWRYLLRRARHGPRRVLSLLVYAESVDLAVPRQAVDELLALLYGLTRPQSAETGRERSLLGPQVSS